MKSLVIYLSVHHNNTEKIARAISRSLSADLLNLDEASIESLENYDKIGFGSGIYLTKHHKKLFEFINALPAQENKKAFVFSTSGTGLKMFNNPLESKLREKGFQVTGSFMCKGYDTHGASKFIGGINKGRPNEDDIKNATLFAETLKR
ncbi:MAG TPA: flavodoxin family protein [Candidatus Krumholzibacteriaceae bacterium]|nr:flavodoxin family protein [Candidatus Krumholzibacteriaceae bacterium]